MGWFSKIATDPSIRYAMDMAKAQKAARDEAKKAMGFSGGGILGTAAFSLRNPEAMKGYVQQFGKPKGGGPSQWGQNYMNTHPAPVGSRMEGYIQKQPWYQAQNLSSLNGLAAPPTGQMPSGPMAPPQGQTQRMIAPDGTQQDVPMMHVQHYLSRGGRLA